MNKVPTCPFCQAEMNLILKRKIEEFDYQRYITHNGHWECKCNGEELKSKYYEYFNK